MQHWYFFFSISISMNIVKIQDKPQREIRPTDIYAYKPQKEIRPIFPQQRLYFRFCLSLKMPPFAGCISDVGIFLKSEEFRGVYGCTLLRVDVAVRFVSPSSELARHEPFLVYITVLTLHRAQVKKAWWQAVYITGLCLNSFETSAGLHPAIWEHRPSSLHVSAPVHVDAL